MTVILLFTFKLVGYNAAYQFVGSGGVWGACVLCTAINARGQQQGQEQK